VWDEDRTYQLTFFLRDYDGATGKVILHLPVALSAYVKQFCIEMADLIRNVSNCALTRIRITMSAAAISPIIATGSAANYGVFIYSTITPEERCVYCIPGIKSSKIVSIGDGAGIIIDTTDSDVAAYIAETINNIVVSPWGADIIALNVAGMELRPYMLEKRDMR
jgi:hypothetical protein